MLFGSMYSRKYVLAVLMAGIVASSPGYLRAADVRPIEVPTPADARLISQDQFKNVLSGVLGEKIKTAMRFAPVPRVKGLLAIGASSVTITPAQFAQLEAAARAIADQVADAGHRDYLVPCTAPANQTAAQACLRKFYSNVGRLLFRRPLLESEVSGYTQNALKFSQLQGGDFYRGLASSFVTMLLAPDFLMTIERTEPDTAHKGSVRLDAYSKATRLSLLLWNSYPDEELLEAAEKGELHTRKGLERQVTRMMSMPQLENGAEGFFKDMLKFEGFDQLSKDPTIYPEATPAFPPEVAQSTLLTVIDHVIAQDADYRDLFTTRTTFVNGDLATFYRLPTSNPLEYTKIQLPPDSLRAGLITQLGFLAEYSHPGRSSPTRRGKAIREVFMCQVVPDPPPNVDFSGFQDPKSVSRTARERLTIHRTNPVCAGCHKVTDPMGLALENFDGAGKYRATENGASIDPSGELEGTKFSDAAGLGKILHDSPTVTSCVVNRLASYSLGRALNADEGAWTAQLLKDFASQGYRIKALLQDIALSDTFYAVPQPKSQLDAPKYTSLGTAGRAKQPKRTEGATS
jgi:hypothetical protein